MRKRERKSITARMPKIRLYSSSISSAFLGDAPDFGEGGGAVFNYLQGLVPKGVHQAAGDGRANP